MAPIPSPSLTFASPKSSTFTVPSGVILMLAGFRSRWMMPFSCAASSASAIWRAIGSASSSGNGPRHPLGQRLAFDELEHERADAFGVLEPVDRADVRMIQRRQHPRFAFEARQPLGVVRERARQDLDGDIAAQPRIAGAIDSPIPPAPRRACT